MKYSVSLAMACLFLFSASAEASDAYCSPKEDSYYGNLTNVKKAWIEVDTYEKLEKFFNKKKELVDASLMWDECFYRPWFNAWKSGRTKLSFDEALREGTEPIETCTSFAKCGPRPDWRSPKDKAAEAAVLKSRQK